MHHLAYMASITTQLTPRSSRNVSSAGPPEEKPIPSDSSAGGPTLALRSVLDHAHATLSDAQFAAGCSRPEHVDHHMLWSTIRSGVSAGWGARGLGSNRAHRKPHGTIARREYRSNLQGKMGAIG